jgi:phosphate/sulfate permease
MTIGYSIILTVLMLLAVCMLIAGVSNDAVNFLNGAIGSKATSLKVILAVAAAGILLGTTFSGGMIEVARKGLFNPAAFTFKEVMVIFLAAMLTGLILLDLFNTFGLPTSTTVIMIFGVLGAAVGIAIIKISNASGDFGEMAKYINSGKTLAIISGILVSVVLAFAMGIIVQWVIRFFFTFNFENRIRYYGGIFGGFAITCMLYFILIKGFNDSIYSHRILSHISLKDWLDYFNRQDFDGYKSLVYTLQNFTGNTDFVSWGTTLISYDKDSYLTGITEFTNWAKTNSNLTLGMPIYLNQFVNYYAWQILLFGFLITTTILQLLNWLFKLNILKFIVLLGTFALALSFAGNDMVNFIGVPLAGLAAQHDFISSSAGANPDNYLMTGLLRPFATPTILFLISGMIMVITLWLGKKVRTVINTSLNLSDQNMVNERFESNALARSIVRQSIKIGNLVGPYIPTAIRSKITDRFNPEAFVQKSQTGLESSFDLIRGAVMLFVSSAIIALGTSLKLPVSTTYVTFMVAMGTSLADGAWDRESAVYRVTGVITVIGGWFITTFSAFTITLIVAMLLIKTWWIGIILMTCLTAFLLIKSYWLHKNRTEESELISDTLKFNDTENIYESCSNNITSILIATIKLYDETIEQLSLENRKLLKQSLKAVKKINNEAKIYKKKIPSIIKDLSDDSIDSAQFYAEIIDYTREAMHCLEYITLPAYKHVDNNHKPLTEIQIESLKDILAELKIYISYCNENILEANYKNSALVIEDSLLLVEQISKIKKKHLKSIKKEPGSTRTNILYLDMLNETRNMVLFINNMYKSFRDFAESNKPMLKHKN